MKGENDEGERSIDGMTVWAKHLYHLPTGYTGCPKKMCTVRAPYYCCRLQFFFFFFFFKNSAVNVKINLKI